MHGCYGPCRYDAVVQLEAAPNNQPGICTVATDTWVQATVNINSLASNAEAQTVAQKVTNVFASPDAVNGAQVSSTFCQTATWPCEYSAAHLCRLNVGHAVALEQSGCLNCMFCCAYCSKNGLPQSRLLRLRHA